jgi:hypothetical protein
MRICKFKVILCNFFLLFLDLQIDEVEDLSLSVPENKLHEFGTGNKCMRREVHQNHCGKNYNSD